MTRPAEVWRTIPTTHGLYEASNKGRIRSTNPRTGDTRVLSPSGGIFAVARNGRRRRMTVTRAVALAFHGEPENPRAVAQHISIDLTDNRPSNLRWVVR